MELEGRNRMKTTPIAKLKSQGLTSQIFIAMILGAIVGLILKAIPASWPIGSLLVNDILNTGGAIFVNLIKMLVVPLVLISLLCGICSLDDIKKVGEIGVKAIFLFIATTALAITIALIVANLLSVGSGVHFPAVNHIAATTGIPSLKQFFTDIFPSNPFQALASANMLQIIVFALFFGTAINLSGDPGKRIAAFFNDLNVVVMKAVMIILRTTPYGVFCLITVLFAKLGLNVFLQLLNYFLTVILVLAIHTIFVYGSLLKFVAKLSPKQFFKKMYGVMMFAFSVSSSNAALPMTMKVVEEKLGVDKAITSFVLSLGTNMNKNGTAIMQGVAAIFIANAYNIEIGFVGNLMIVITATLASISTAGAPSIGVLSLVIVLRQVGLPIEGIAIILAIDRFIDMLRTSVNVAGNAVIACIIGRSEHGIDPRIYNSNSESFVKKPEETHEKTSTVNSDIMQHLR